MRRWQKCVVITNQVNCVAFSINTGNALSPETFKWKDLCQGVYFVFRLFLWRLEICHQLYYHNVCLNSEHRPKNSIYHVCTTWQSCSWANLGFTVLNWKINKYLSCLFCVYRDPSSCQDELTGISLSGWNMKSGRIELLRSNDNWLLPSYLCLLISEN